MLELLIGSVIAAICMLIGVVIGWVLRGESDEL